MRERDKRAIMAALRKYRIYAKGCEDGLEIVNVGLKVYILDLVQCRWGDPMLAPTRQIKWSFGSNSGWMDGGACSACHRCKGIVPAPDRWRGRGWPERMALEIRRFLDGFRAGQTEPKR